MLKLFLILVLPLICEASVLDVTTEKPTRGISILNIQSKKTLYTTGYQLDCLKLFIDTYYYLENTNQLKLIKFVSILRERANSIFGSKTDVAYLFMDSCDGIDNINIENKNFEVKLSNNKWAYFEDGECKAKDFEQSQLPKTTWTRK